MNRALRYLLLTAMSTCAVVLARPAVAHADGGTWEAVGSIEGVETWRKSVPGTDLLAFKGQITAPVHIGKLLSVFLDRNQRRYWVDKFADTKTIEQDGPLSEIYWIRFALPVVSDRDYVLKADGSADATTHVFTANIKSINDPRKPLDDCCVRAQAIGTYYKFEALKGTPERTRITVEVRTDPKGSLPDFIINMIQKKWPSKTLGGLVARTRKTNPASLPDYTAWHE
jgi:hypothetical protein